MFFAIVALLINLWAPEISYAASKTFHLPGSVIDTESSSFNEDPSLPTPEDALYILKKQNFSWLEEGYIAGMQQPSHTLDTVAALAALNIGAIFSLIDDPWHDHEATLLKAYGIEHYCFPIDEVFSRDTCDEFYRLMQTLITLSARLAENNKAIVVHCQLGINRTGGILGSWLMIHSPNLLEYETVLTPFKIIKPILAEHRRQANPGMLTAILRSDRDQLATMRSPTIVNAVKNKFRFMDEESIALPRHSTKSAPIHPAPHEEFSGPFAARSAAQTQWVHQTPTSAAAAAAVYKASNGEIGLPDSSAPSAGTEEIPIKTASCGCSCAIQ